MNREAWLNRVVRALRLKFRAAGYPLPKKIAVSCGWPSSAALPNLHGVSTEGEFWSARQSGGVCNIFISPLLSDGVEVAGLLVHELLHAALDHTAPPDPHRGEFPKGMRCLGLLGAPTATHASRELKAELRAIVEHIGPYPHKGLRP